MIFSGIVVLVAAVGFVVVLQHVDGDRGIAAEMTRSEAPR